MSDEHSPITGEDPEGNRRTAPDGELERVIEKVSLDHGFDVRGYKRSTLYRRLRRRMADAGCKDPEDYLLRLETDRHEYSHLVNTILINVTEFFRDHEAWDYLQRECLAGLIQRRPAGHPIRAWCAGCATGEEAYSVAMSLAELLGDRPLRDLKIYATDMDEGSLAVARAGIYQPDDLRHLTPQRAERFFDALPGGRYMVRRELRSAVIFGRHNVLVDPPISRLDILVCRNLLIYFDSATQQQLLSRFHYALRNDGYLFLGKAETLMSRSMLFRPLEPRYRVFQRVPQQGGTEPLFGGNAQQRRPAGGTHSSEETDEQNYTLHAIVDRAADPVLLLDPSGRLLMASERARTLFELNETHLGRSFLEMAERFRPVPLRLAIEEVRATGRTARIEEMDLGGGPGELLALQMEVRPILDPNGTLIQILLWGRDVSIQRRLVLEVAQLRQEMETLNEELQTANEELETTNEELQSTNEELETTNEELQSTNEELETTVEELQSTNEELETANEELRVRQEEVDALARYQNMVLAGLQSALIAVNPELVVTGWNRASEETWGLREAEVVGLKLLDLDSGLDFKNLRQPLGQVLGGGGPQQTTVAATNRRGRPIHCRVQLNPLTDDSPAIAGAVLLIDVLPPGTDGA